jgi:hypothetical protein
MASDETQFLGDFAPSQAGDQSTFGVVDNNGTSSASSRSGASGSWDEPPPSSSHSADALEAAIATYLAPVAHEAFADYTAFLGVSTAWMGVTFDYGVYVDRNWGAGVYFASGIALGSPAPSVAIVKGESRSFSGSSISRSEAAWGLVRATSFDTSLEHQTGSLWGLGTPGRSITLTYTVPMEITNLYLDYIEILNWIRYPGPNGY